MEGPVCEDDSCINRLCRPCEPINSQGIHPGNEFDLKMGLTDPGVSGRPRPWRVRPLSAQLACARGCALSYAS